MKRTLVLLITLSCFLSSFAQPKIRDKKYPSLLWEISGRGLKKPSYLIGTMHVSNKLAFHLPDSFYLAIRSAQVVALETNPETWQDDMNKFDFSGINANNLFGGRYGNYLAMPSDYLNLRTLKFDKYDEKIEKALYTNPATINSLLYRSYGNESSDFEEDTYLDMYIFQCGKKWGKKVTGVEDYGESMRLMAEAYRDAAKDKNKKERSYDGAEEYSVDKLQDAYRTGNLDLLDSINKFNSVSAAFDEKFLYRRNEIQANSIDSILRTGASLFAGVGAAHLPGERGVIEILRAKGYQLRPVKMGERDSQHKDIVDKIRVPVSFHTETAEDGLFKVDIPGKFYKQETGGTNTAVLDQQQFADMSNGSYYMVTRIVTDARMWGHSTEQVYKNIDSLLYENIPGKIISKTTIYKNGYKGFDITNRTRRGDLQRYNIFITPFEIIFFKMSGNGEYVKNGEEAAKFFGSIQLREYKTPAPASAWIKYAPSFGGFAVELPHEPFVHHDGNWYFDAEDQAGAAYYRVIRTDIHNYRFAEEDSFDLSLLNESFMASDFIGSEISRKQTTYKGYPALDVKLRDKDGGIFLNRYIIQGPHYYTLVAHGKQETAAMNNFLNSFEIKPFIYGESKYKKDTALYYSVLTPVFPTDKKIKLDIPRFGYLAEEGSEDSEAELLEAGAYRNTTISNDSTGEKIYVSFFRSHQYYYTKDSADLEKDNQTYLGDSSWIYKLKKKWVLPNKIKVWETIVTDTGSSRTLWTKVFYKDGIGFSIATESDTLTAPSTFVKKFFDTYTPADTLKGIDPFQRKTNLFFDDLMSSDSARHKKAVRSIDAIDISDDDLPRLKLAISSLNWNEKKYLDTKSSLIEKLKEIKTKASADYLKELYYALDDTVRVQYVVLESLLQHQTAYAYNVFRNIINTEPPVLNAGDDMPDYSGVPGMKDLGQYEMADGSFLDELSDTLQLTTTILPDLLPLLNLDDYKNGIMRLLAKMVDSNLIKPSDYQFYFSKFFLEAKQELKKQAIAEKQKAIDKAEESKEDVKESIYSFGRDESDAGNDRLHLYATLLLPFWDSYKTVPVLIGQMLGSNDKRLKYNTLLLLIQHGKPYPDSLISYYGSMDEYRYELYSDLKKMGRLELFPARYNNHLDLGRSSLMKEAYERPDTLVYIDRLTASYKGKTGYIYFYKYKNKTEDLSWKLATVGLVPMDPKSFEFDDNLRSTPGGFNYSNFFNSEYIRYDFTSLSDTKLSEDEPVSKQLNKALKKMLYSLRKSAAQFYQEEYSKSPLLMD